MEFPFGCPLRELENKGKVSIVTPESVRGRLRECVNTEFVWELKHGFVKAVVGRAVRLRECPLRELPLCLTLKP